MPADSFDVELPAGGLGVLNSTIVAQLLVGTQSQFDRDRLVPTTLVAFDEIVRDPTVDGHPHRSQEIDGDLLSGPHLLHVENQVLVLTDLATIKTDQDVAHSKHSFRREAGNHFLDFDPRRLNASRSRHHSDPDRTARPIDDSPLDGAQQPDPLFLEKIPPVENCHQAVIGGGMDSKCEHRLHSGLEIVRGQIIDQPEDFRRYGSGPYSLEIQGIIDLEPPRGPEDPLDSSLLGHEDPHRWSRIDLHRFLLPACRSFLRG